MKIELALSAPVSACFLAALAFAGDGVDLTPRAPFPAPRHSGTGHVDFGASNVQLMSWKTLFDFEGGNDSASDCWGYTSPSGREYALIGMSAGTGIVEVTDPGRATIVAFVRRPPSAMESRWRCIKTYQGFAYVGSEGGGGIQIIDLRSIDAGSVSAHSINGSTCTTSTHTLALDETSGFLYRCGGIGCGTLGMAIYSLADPANPVHVGDWNTGRYFHEAQVLTWDQPGPYLGHQIAFGFTELDPTGQSPQLQILDVTDKSAIHVLSAHNYPGNVYCHQGWLSADRHTMYLNDEKDDLSYGPSRTRLFDVSDLRQPAYLGFFASGAASIDHNLYVKGNRLFESNYTSGLRVFDSTNPSAPVQIGFFDTQPDD